MEAIKPHKPYLLISSVVIIFTLSFSVFGSSQEESDYFTCAGKLLETISDVRVLVNVVDEVDYKNSALEQCDPNVVNCERVKNEVIASKNALEQELLKTKQRFLQTIDYCLVAKPSIDERLTTPF